MADQKARRRQAAALRYEAGQARAPQVVARGEGYVAEAIVAAARQHGVPVHESPDLVRLLARLPIDSAIPADLYLAVAEVLIFLLRTASAQQAPAPSARQLGPAG